jgi:hypothetical protein
MISGMQHLALLHRQHLSDHPLVSGKDRGLGARHLRNDARDDATIASVGRLLPNVEDGSEVVPSVLNTGDTIRIELVHASKVHQIARPYKSIRFDNHGWPHGCVAFHPIQPCHAYDALVTLFRHYRAENIFAASFDIVGTSHSIIGAAA